VLEDDASPISKAQRGVISALALADFGTASAGIALTHHVSRNNIVITMKVMHVSIRQIGNSQGVVIPKPVLAQLGLSGEAGADMTIEGDALVLRRPASPVRTGWAEAARKIAEVGDDELVTGEFGNAGDTELAW
jgi:antitoxin MazE